jgi:hypothetical protein
MATVIFPTRGTYLTLSIFLSESSSTFWEWGHTKVRKRQTGENKNYSSLASIEDDTHIVGPCVRNSL